MCIALQTASCQLRDFYSNKHHILRAATGIVTLCGAGIGVSSVSLTVFLHILKKKNKRKKKNT